MKKLICLFIVAILLSGCATVQQRDWEETVARNTTSAYEQFIRTYPNAPQAKEAQETCQILREREINKNRLLSSFNLSGVHSIEINIYGPGSIYWEKPIYGESIRAGESYKCFNPHNDFSTPINWHFFGWGPDPRKVGTLVRQILKEEGIKENKKGDCKLVVNLQIHFYYFYPSQPALPLDIPENPTKVAIGTWGLVGIYIKSLTEDGTTTDEDSCIYKIEEAIKALTFPNPKSRDRYLDVDYEKTYCWDDEYGIPFIPFEHFPKKINTLLKEKYTPCKSELGALRAAITIFYAKSASEGKGKWPTVEELKDMLVGEKIPVNPYTGFNTIKIGTKGDVDKNVGWIYDIRSGEIWDSTGKDCKK